MTPAQIIKANYIATKIRFVPWWTKTKTIDKTTKQRMCEPVNAQSNSIRSYKDAYSTEIPAIAEINALRDKTRDYWENNTLPYSEDSVRLLRRVDLPEFNAYMDNVAKVQLPAHAANVQNARDLIIEDARKRLGDTFSINHYPIDLSTLYGIEVTYPTLSPNGSLPKEILDQQRKLLEAKITEAAVQAQQNFTNLFAEHIQHLAERLTTEPGQKKVFRDSAVDNLKEFFAQFEKLKISEGDELDKLVADAQNLIKGIAPADLRSSEALKAEIAGALTTIEKKLTPLIVNAPRRKIIRPTNIKETPNEAELQPA